MSKITGMLTQLVKATNMLGRIESHILANCSPGMVQNLSSLPLYKIWRRTELP